MRFKKNVSAEKREILKEQLKKYKKEMSMNEEEQRLLEEWVSNGNSPYDNGDYISTDYGYPMDFVNALRFVDDLNEWFNSLPKEKQEELRNESVGYDTQSDEIVFDFPGRFPREEIDEELPFG